MIDLVLDILLLDERRLKRRLAGLFLSLLMPFVFLGLLVVWISFAAFEAISLRLSEFEAAMIMVLLFSVLAAGSVGWVLRRQTREKPEHFLDALIASLADRRAHGDRGGNDDLAALILLVASQVQRRGDKTS